MSAPVHATVVARRLTNGWVGALLTGPSGAGKSDLALRLIARGWRLVSDDYSQVWRSDGSAYAGPPDRLPPDLIGHIEARGLGLIEAGAVRPFVRIALIVACGHETAERLPEPEVESLVGIEIVRLSLDVRPASASLLVERALDRATANSGVRRL